MFKFLKGLVKFIEGALFLFVPIVVFYWSLTLINLDIVRPIISFLGSFIEPLVLPYKPYIEYTVQYDTFSVNYTVLFFGGLVLVAALMCIALGHILNFVETLFSTMFVYSQRKTYLKRKEEEKIEFQKELEKNRYIYVTLKLIKNEPKETYLIKEGEADFFSVGLVDSYESSLANVYKKFSGRACGNIGGLASLNNYIFSDLNKFLEFLPFFMTRVEEVNKGMLDLNVKFEYKIACHCSYSDANPAIDFEITSKILNLCGDKEILLSEILKNKLELSKNENIKLFSRGIYLIKDKQMDVFKLKF